MLLTRGSSAYTNDANGNTLIGGGRTNTWDSQNRMTRCVMGANTSTFTYGSDGIRHKSVVNGTSTDFVLDNSMFVREMSGGAVKATYFMGASGPAYRRDDVSGAVRWYLYDGLGSVLGEVDPNGTITATRKYDVYGAVRSSTGMSTSKHKFVGSLGHPSEDETGLTYMRARYYDPQAGRFTSEDLALNGTNWYTYCCDNPINLVDESGKAASSNLENWLGRFAIACLGMIIGYLVYALVFNFKASTASYLVLGIIAAITSSTAGVYGPSLISDIRNFLKSVDALDKSDGGTGAGGIAKTAVEAETGEVGNIYGELLTEEVENASEGGQLTLPLE